MIKLTPEIKTLTALMEAKLRRIPFGSELLESAEFRIYDSKTRERISLKKDWKSCFSPGQEVEMSITFTMDVFYKNLCPSSRSSVGLAPESSGKCLRCYGLLRDLARFYGYGRPAINIPSTKCWKTSPLAYQDLNRCLLYCKLRCWTKSSNSCQPCTVSEHRSKYRWNESAVSFLVKACASLDVSWWKQSAGRSCKRISIFSSNSRTRHIS